MSSECPRYLALQVGEHGVLATLLCCQADRVLFNRECPGAQLEWRKGEDMLEKKEFTPSLNVSGTLGWFQVISGHLTFLKSSLYHELMFFFFFVPQVKQPQYIQKRPPQWVLCVS